MKFGRIWQDFRLFVHSRYFLSVEGGLEVKSAQCKFIVISIGSRFMVHRNLYKRSSVRKRVGSRISLRRRGKAEASGDGWLIYLLRGGVWYCELFLVVCEK